MNNSDKKTIGANIASRNDEIINYSLRPAKNIERKMICEALSRVSSLENIKDYQYVGFGSTYFTDFILFHRNLGIQKLISIECEQDMEPRVRFNSPYSCIDIKIGNSTDKLPEIEWEKHKSILWLDYTSMLKGYMFSDIKTFFDRAISGSVFIISINAELKDVTDQTTSARIRKKLTQDHDIEKRVSKTILNQNLKKGDYYRILKDIIIQEIENTLSLRNKFEPGQDYRFNQLFNFIYHDGQAMLTVGGIFYNKKDKQKVKSMSFANLNFYRDKDEYFEISVPHLTVREIQAIDKFLPSFNESPENQQLAFRALKNVVSDTAIEKYAKIYQYFPQYKEVAL